MVGYVLDILIGLFYLILGLYVIRCYFLKCPKEKVNIIFLSIISLLYAFEWGYVLIRGHGLWGYSPLMNMSPLLFALSFVALFLPKERQSEMFGFFAMFFIPMILAAFVPLFIDVMIDAYNFNFATIADTLAHLTFGMFGYYLILSRQVKADKYSLGFYVVNCLVVVIGIIFINLIFHTRFFGLSFYGGHNIYRLVITSSAILSCMAYVVGVVVVVLFGYWIYKIMTKRLLNKEKNAVKSGEK